MKLLLYDYSMFDHNNFLNDFTYTDVNFALKVLSKFVKFKNKKVYMHGKKSLSWFCIGNRYMILINLLHGSQGSGDRNSVTHRLDKTYVPSQIMRDRMYMYVKR